jgi:hypothetical protein
MGKRRKHKLRKRFHTLDVNITGKEATDEPGVIKINVSLDFVNGTSKVFNAFNNEVFESSGMTLGYIGENKWRTTTQVSANANDHSYCFQAKLDRFKHLVAIDTNTIFVHQPVFSEPTRVSLGAAVIFVEEESGLYLKPINRPFLASFNSTKPENENWMHLIELLKKKLLMRRSKNSWNCGR